MKITAKRSNGLKKVEESYSEQELELQWKRGNFFIKELIKEIEA